MLTPLAPSVQTSYKYNPKDVHLDEIGRRCEVGDWKLLYLLAKNMEPLVFGEFLR